MDELIRRLLTEQNECVLSWLMQDGCPASAVVSFVWLDEAIGLTALEGSPRVKAIRRNPNVALVVSGKGSPVGHSRCVSIRGECHVRSDREIRDRFFPAFSRAVLPASEAGAEQMARSMNTPENLVLLVTPRNLIPYDAQASLDRANRM